MKIDDPLTEAVYQVLTLLPAATDALHYFIDQDCWRGVLERSALDLSRHWQQHKIFAASDIAIFDRLLGELHASAPQPEMVWIDDEYCMSGGWYQPNFTSEERVKQRHLSCLDQLSSALRQMQNVREAHRIAFQVLT